ncbi:Hypothetical predicted protein [Olea europaea subsp. europaea]|uniref:Uncharacterized protein n=1 Tax=Olea europaea subsp. europaea TaxID=158383 RepID=A0A8S0PVH3_OLEEU|nr:Hypothetical predicted protein [Olea europaea subsp. europaea]
MSTAKGCVRDWLISQGKAVKSSRRSVTTDTKSLNSQPISILAEHIRILLVKSRSTKARPKNLSATEKIGHHRQVISSVDVIGSSDLRGPPVSLTGWVTKLTLIKGEPIKMGDDDNDLPFSEKIRSISNRFDSIETGKEKWAKLSLRQLSPKASLKFRFHRTRDHDMDDCTVQMSKIQLTEWCNKGII